MKKSTYKVTFESDINTNILFMGKMVDAISHKKFEYIIECKSKEDAISLAQQQHTLPINKTTVINLDSKFSITTSEYKYGELKSTETETFDSNKEMSDRYHSLIKMFCRSCSDKWEMEVTTSDGKSRRGKIDL